MATARDGVVCSDIYRRKYGQVDFEAFQCGFEEGVKYARPHLAMTPELQELQKNIEKAYINLVNAITEEANYYKQRCEEMAANQPRIVTTLS